MKHALFVAIPLLSLPTIASAADFGIGASFKSDDQAIYAPISLSSSFRVEPYFVNVQYTSKNDSYKYSRSIREYGVGLFGKKSAKDNVEIYCGARLARVETSSRSNYSVDPSDYGNISEKENQIGYAIAPALGFEYFIVPKLSVGGEADYVYRNTDGKDKEVTKGFEGLSGRNQKIESTTTYTETRVMLRYYF